MDIIYFLGRFHVLALHLPIGIIIAALGLEWLTRKDPSRHLSFISTYLWGLAAGSAILTVVLGYMHITEGGFSGPSASAHRLFGTTLAVATTLVWVSSAIWKTLYQRARPLIALILLVLITLTGHYGGNLTHGSTYLVEYAPSPLRALAGLDKRRPEIINLSMADVYLDVINPMLQTRCGACHNEDKRRGQFSLASYESTIAGGESGLAIIPGEPNAGELSRRITLATEHADFMPADGKTPLTPEQTELLTWWIESGAPASLSLSEMNFDSTIESLLMIELGLSAGPQTSSSGGEEADPQLITDLYQAGFLIRQVAQNNIALDVSVYSRNTAVSGEQLDVLLQAAEQIAILDLQGTSLNDQSLAEFSNFTHLTHLRLNNNVLSDTAINYISSLPKLEYLNLYGNLGVSDKSIETLAGIASLTELYIWQTSLSDSGVERLRLLRPDLHIETGTSARILP